MARTAKKVSMKEWNTSKFITYIYCTLVAFLFLLICSRSSFLYPCNDWNDANCFFTMGKGMMNGKILYRDLFEQKGPYLFLIYGIAWLLSSDSFFGVFILEIAALSVFLYYAMKLITLYCKRGTALFLLPILACGMTVSWSFYWGGSAEEFCLPFMSVSLYYVVKHYKEKKNLLMDKAVLFANGILAGVVLQIKFNLLGFWFAWMLFYLMTILKERKWVEIFKSSAVFLIGMLIPSIPWIVYFVLNGSLMDYYYCYIYNNIFLYADVPGGPGIGEKIYLLMKILYYLILDNTSYFAFVIFGLFVMTFSWKTNWSEKINICLLFGFTFLGIYIGDANLPYYSIPLMTFAIVGVAYLGQIIDFIFWKVKIKWKTQALQVAAYCFVILCCSGIAYKYSGNTYFMSYEKEDFFLYRFKDVIDQEENPTLLNYGCLDVGLYTVADIMPTCKFFHTCNMDYPQMTAEQLRYIQEGCVQFVVSGNNYPDIIFDKYELVASEVYMHFGTPTDYYLFRLKNTPN